MKLLIAESGATKTDWCYLENGKPVYFKTGGLHPFFLSKDVKQELNALSGRFSPDRIFFYGAGISDYQPGDTLAEILNNLFPLAELQFFSDITAAARSSFADDEGIVALLGTGSACGYFKNGDLQHKAASMGFAIGDEGSAADLGKRILKGYYRDLFSSETIDLISKVLNNRSYQEMMNLVYASERPSFTLAGFAGDILGSIHTDELEKLTEAAFTDFINAMLLPVYRISECRVVFSGRVAVANASVLKKCAEQAGISSYSIADSVISGLAEYHISKLKEP
jgi:hypothetical protein